MTKKNILLLKKLERSINKILILEKIYNKQLIRKRIEQLENELEGNKKLNERYYSYLKDRRQQDKEVINIKEYSYMERVQLFSLYEKDKKIVRKKYLYNHLINDVNYKFVKRKEII